MAEVLPDRLVKDALMKMVLAGTAFAALMIAAPASAQEPGGSFSGPRIEVRGGWDFLNLEATLSDGTDRIVRDGGKSGASYGDEIGYDNRTGNLVVGGYAGIEGSTVKECAELLGNDELCLKSGRNITAGLRVGTVVSDNFMIYAKGGYSNGRATLEYRDNDLAYWDMNLGDNLSGFHLGAGVEGELRGGVYGRLEYVYSDYGSESVQVDNLRAASQPTRHQVLYGMGVRF